MDKHINLVHGDGGVYTNQLYKEVIFKYFKPSGKQVLDSALINLKSKDIAFTTDSFVVNPLVFPGGNIGTLSVCGVVNDLVAVGANPEYLSLSLIIEEGFEVAQLNKILMSIKSTCQQAGSIVITGDTKVVELGKVDGLFINMTAIGSRIWKIFPQQKVNKGDAIIVTGGISEHGTAIAAKRYGIETGFSINSDCRPLNSLFQVIGNDSEQIIWMRDPTRGGIGTILNEFAYAYRCSIVIEEEKIPIKKEVRTITNMLGLNPYYLTSQGIMIMVVKRNEKQHILNKLHKHQIFRDAKCIGTIVNKEETKVMLQNKDGNTKKLTILEKSILPRMS